MNHYEIFFTYEGQVLKLPQNPETLPVELEGENEAYNVLGIGPITVPREPKQKRIRIEGLFPGENDTPPETYIKFFQDAMYEQRIIVYTPVRAYETGTPFNGGDDGFQCLVENFSTEERGGETGDFYYSLEIVEYRDYSPKIVEVRPVQTGYAMSTSNTRTSEGVQVGDRVQVNGPVYSYPTDNNSVGNANGATGTVERKENRNGKNWMQVKMDNLVKGNVRENQGKVHGPSASSGSSSNYDPIIDWSSTLQPGNSAAAQFARFAAEEGSVKAYTQTFNPTTGEYVTYSINDEAALGMGIISKMIGKKK